MRWGKKGLKMVANIVSLLAKAFTTNNVKTTSVTRISSNPFASHVTFQGSRNSYNSYAKNNPVQGGYFAGYYNGRANIVGQRLFVEA